MTLKSLDPKSAYAKVFPGATVLEYIMASLEVLDWLPKSVKVVVKEAD